MVFFSSNATDASKRPRLAIILESCENPVKWSYSVDDKNVQFFDSTFSGSNWYWDFGDGYFSGLQNPLHQYADSGTYNVCLTLSETCGERINCRDIFICEQARAQFDHTVSVNKLVTFTNNSLNADAYFWDFGDMYY